MMIEVTRSVVEDLWPLVRAGEASAESRALVDAFLTRDAELAATLKSGEDVRRLVPALRLSPDAERVLIESARDRARMKLLILGGSIAAAALLLLASFAGALVVMLHRM